MTRLQKIEATVYACLWVFAFYVVFQDVISPRKPDPVAAQVAANSKLTSRQVMMGVRRATNR